MRVAFEWRAGFNQHWGYAPKAVKLWDRFERDVVSRFAAYQLPAAEEGIGKAARFLVGKHV